MSGYALIILGGMAILYAFRGKSPPPLDPLIIRHPIVPMRGEIRSRIFFPDLQPETALMGGKHYFD